MDEKFKQKTVSGDELTNKLRGSSPLQASKILIETELFEKKSSLDVLDGIYDHFENKESLIDELVTPIGLNVLDGIISHKKLNLKQTGVTASRLWSEIKGFEYSTAGINASALSSKQQLDGMTADLRTPKKFVRDQLEDKDAMGDYKKRHFNSNNTAYSEVETKDGRRTRLYKSESVAGEDRRNLVANADHIVSLKELNDRYSKNVFLKEGDLKVVANSDDNLSVISARVNKSKNDISYLERKGQKDSGENPDAVYSSINDETYEQGALTEAEAGEAIRKNLSNKAVGNLKSIDSEVAKKIASPALGQTAYQALGTAIIETIKPIFHELSDSIKNGFEQGVGATDLLEAITIRFTRVFDYLKKVIIPTLKGAVKDLFQNISKILIEGILGLVTGIFKSILKVLSEGFSAIISAVKILSSDSKDMSAAEKGDAIVKLLATTVSTFVVFYFSDSIAKLIPEPFDDILVAIASGVASTLVVYLIDKLDLFSVKHEKRSKLVAEIFQERIATIKKNTDAFNAASVQELAAQKVAFKKLYESFESGIDKDIDVTGSVNSIADFMHIDLEIRDTESFLDTLKREKILVI
ncbi:MAG: hypothetical protein ACJAW8_001618 [Oleispira sp.]|jgi:hypothetical protein